ncbi:unnamed protein product, partial [Callosobruchus maculatus]
AIVTKAGENEANHLRKRFLTAFRKKSVTLRYTFGMELDDSRAFTSCLKYLWMRLCRIQQCRPLRRISFFSLTHCLLIKYINKFKQIVT